MAYILPKSKEGQRVHEHLKLFAHRFCYTSGMHFTREAKAMPKEFGAFLMPHGDDVTEEEFIAAGKKHIEKHGWRLDPVWVKSVTR